MTFVNGARITETPQRLRVVFIVRKDKLRLSNMFTVRGHCHAKRMADIMA